MGVWYCCMRYPPVLFLASSSYSPKSHVLCTSPRNVLDTQAYLPMDAVTCIWAHTHACVPHAVCIPTGEPQEWQVFGGWMVFGEHCKITSHLALCTPTDCHTGRKRGPGWKGWASLLATEGEFLLLALLLVVHSPYYCQPGTPLAPPSAHAPHYSRWVINLKKEK